MIGANIRLVFNKQQQQRLKDNLDSIHVLRIFRQSTNKPPQTPGSHRLLVLSGEAPQAHYRGAPVLQERACGQAQAQCLDCRCGILLWGSLGLEDAKE